MNFRNIENRIIGGVETTIEAHPYQAVFRLKNEFVCSASILTTTRALTAAFCVSVFPDIPPSSYSILAGSTLSIGDANQQVRILTEVLTHPLYIRMTNVHDVALLYWEEPLSLGATVQTIAIPLQDSPVPYGENSNVTGWGLTREHGSGSAILNVVTVPLISNDDCNQAYNGHVSDDMLCAGLPEGGRDACNGDSGSPLTVNGVQLGVVSWGKGCARPGYPGVYARVAYFTNWIHENL